MINKQDFRNEHRCCEVDVLAIEAANWCVSDKYDFKAAVSWKFGHCWLLCNYLNALFGNC